ncbi:iron ABC transporter permease [Petroclostridium sp. X23]|uniref:FecCD family ABC transporter permease n=1 Tax=Petroclostridium sp. X23 TaxID=3045146 RepID=UPI0024AD9F40|nr:iron ABC transporter permease [Petroclostridium sp. X23]WHH60991.1 iron ABC transporter permease [Petroclostridium sp. X23]
MLTKNVVLPKLLHHRYRQKKRWFWVSLFVSMLFLAVLMSIFSGTLQFSLWDVMEVFSGKCEDQLTRNIIWNVRFPRTMTGLLVGVNMAISGALLQGLLRNPLASPNIIGSNSGAGLAAVTVMCLLPGNIKLLPPSAFFGALLAGLIIYGLSRRDGSSSSVTIILAGVALGALLSAFTSAIMILHTDELGITYTWMAGSLIGRGWPYFHLIWPYSLAGILFAVYMSPKINLFLLGEEVGKNLGLSIEIYRLLIIITASVLAGSAVSVAGTIGFIGIVSPHIARMLVGNDYRYLTLMSAVTGGLLLVLSDTLARTLFQPMEIPVGIITATLGAPFFFFLLYKKRSSFPL